MRKILVIDDEKPTLSMFRLFLGAYGYDVLTAESGEEGLEVMDRETPPIVLTDIKMPGMDGIEVLRRIKKLHPMTEVIVITGHGDMDLAIKALNLDATDFINKPIQKADLDAALKRAEERIQLARDKVNEVSTRLEGVVAVMDIRGNVNSTSEPYLNEAYDKLSADGARRIVFNFNENASINGAGIAILIQLLSKSGQAGQSVAISGLSDNFRKVFSIVGISKYATIFDTQAEAVDSLLKPHP